MLVRIKFKFLTVALACLMTCGATAQAQMGPASYGGGPAARGGQIDQSVWVNANGSNAVQPTCFAGGGVGCNQGYQECDGGLGCDPSYDESYGSGEEIGFEAPQGPHYFDFGVEFLHWQRVKIGSPERPLASLGAVVLPAIPTIALSTEDLISDESGVRFTGRIDIGPDTLFEVSYAGLFAWSSTAQFTDPNAGNPAIHTLFTSFQTDGGAFTTHSRAARVIANYKADLHTTELSFRRYWLGNRSKVTGTILAGFRWTRLNEDFQFLTFGADAAATNPNPAPGNLSYDIQTDNDLCGFQTGGDLWISVRPGLRVGGELKLGLYNNRLKSRAVIIDGASGAVVEEAESNHVAFIAETKVQIVADITPHISLKAGYDLMFLDRLALASSQLNADLTGLGARTATLENRGQALYHGFSAGFEYVW